MGIGDWGLVIEQSPIPNPHFSVSTLDIKFKFNLR